MNLAEIIKGIQPIDQEWISKARERTAQLVMPTRALGRLHEISERLCGISKTLQPSIKRKAVLVMAGDHGVVKRRGQCLSPGSDRRHGSNISCRWCRHQCHFPAGGAEVFVVDMGIIAELDGWICREAII